MTRITDSTPTKDGFYMPGEFEPHEGCIMIWPFRPGSWPYGAKDARAAFASVAEAISQSERVIMLVGKEHADSARKLLPEKIEIQIIESDDSWARDTAPTFVKNAVGLVRGVNWRFNAWGGEYNGLYASWDKDDALAGKFCEVNGYDYYDASPFVLEGGSVHSDGEGTLLVTRSCLCGHGRNPSMTRAQIEEKLKAYLGAEKVIWLPCGIYNDETDGHVDNICAFIHPGEVVLAWTDNENDPQYALSKSCLDMLENVTDARGRHIKIHKLPIPDIPVCISQKDLDGFTFQEGEDTRIAGERLAASYVNFYFSNGAVILPQFGGENDKSDRRAVDIMTSLCPERKIIPVSASAIIVGGGNIHCITQQIPKGVKLI